VALVSSVLSILFACAFGTLAGISTAAAAPVPWHIMTSPDTSGSQSNNLSAVSCTSSTFCVAVGSYYNGSAYQTLIETLSGTTWSLSEGPDTSTTESNYLIGVSCTSSTSCVAVGLYYNSSSDAQTLIETLSGTTWSITNSPNTSSSEDNHLYGVSCTSSTSCVAVGYYQAGSFEQTLIETLSGTTWSLKEGPDTSTTETNVLSDVSCTSSTSCVAVGYYYAGSVYQNLIETLSGTTWSITTSPDTSSTQTNNLLSVSCTSSTSCVAVGSYDVGLIAQNLIETLSGGSWSITTSPDTSTSEDNFLYGVSCTSSTWCVGVGYYYNGSIAQNLIETLSGGSWSITTSPDTSTSETNNVLSVSCTSSTSCKAVGASYNGIVSQNLILSTPLSQAITFSPPPPTSALFGSSITLDATGGGSGNPVTFSDSSPDVCSISSTQEASSPYQATIVFIGAGTCVIEANQAGNNSYFAAPEVTEDIAVTYSEPCISGYHTLDVGSGEAVCISPGAVIRGQINVGQGGSIDIEGAAIYGSVTSNGAGVVRICDSKINGAVNVSSSTGPVIIGDEALGCSGNTINGPVSLTSNTGGVTFDDNTVNGPVTITGNSPSLAFFDNTVNGTENVS
jgi:hypothetical protein